MVRTAPLAAVILLLGAAYLWADRLYIINDAGAMVTIVNKWTGSIQFCNPSDCAPVRMASAGQPAIPAPPPGFTIDE